MVKTNKKDESNFATLQLSNGLEVTDIRVYPLNNEKVPFCKAFVSITFNRAFVIKGITIRETKAGDLWLAMQSSKGKDGNYYDNYYFLNKEDLALLEETVVNMFISTSK